LQGLDTLVKGLERELGQIPLALASQQSILHDWLNPAFATTPVFSWDYFQTLLFQFNKTSPLVKFTLDARSEANLQGLCSDYLDVWRVSMWSMCHLLAHYLISARMVTLQMRRTDQGLALVLAGDSNQVQLRLYNPLAFATSLQELKSLLLAHEIVCSPIIHNTISLSVTAIKEPMLV
jgi:hypothetical protein